MHTHRYIVVENRKEAMRINLNTSINQDGYVVGRKNNLKDFMPVLLWLLFANRHLYKNKDSAYNQHNNLWDLQRLNSCLYDIIDKKVMHHIIKNQRANNSISNLIPITESEHTYLDHYDSDGTLAKKLQKKFKDKIFKAKNRTVANNDSIILDVLRYNTQNMPVKEIVKRLGNKIKKSSVYKIIKEFYYDKEFLEYLDAGMDIEISNFRGKQRERWREIIKFDGL